LTGEQQRSLARSYTSNSEAYQLYLKGRYHWAKRTLQIDPLSIFGNHSLGYTYLAARQYHQAIEQLKNTLELDPNSGTHVILSHIYA
jgi:hypothetical protein